MKKLLNASTNQTQRIITKLVIDRRDLTSEQDKMATLSTIQYQLQQAAIQANSALIEVSQLQESLKTLQKIVENPAPVQETEELQLALAIATSLTLTPDDTPTNPAQQINKLQQQIKALTRTIAQAKANNDFFNTLYRSYINYLLKKLKIQLGECLMEQPSNFTKMKELIAQHETEAGHFFNHNIINEQTKNVLLQAYQGYRVFINNRENKQKIPVTLSLSTELSNPCIKINPIEQGAIFYLKDALAKRYLVEQNKGTTVTVQEGNVILDGEADIEQDVSLKFKASRLS